MTTKEEKQTVASLKNKIKSLEKQVEALTEEKDLVWFMLDEMKASDTRKMEISERLNDVVQNQMAKLKMMQMNKGEA